MNIPDDSNEEDGVLERHRDTLHVLREFLTNGRMVAAAQLVSVFV